MFRSASRTSAKTGVAPRVDDDVRRRRPRDRGRDHLVAGPDAERDEREVHRGRARRRPRARASRRGTPRTAARAPPRAGRSSASPSGSSRRPPRSPPRRPRAAGSERNATARLATSSRRELRIGGLEAYELGRPRGPRERLARATVADGEHGAGAVGRRAAAARARRRARGRSAPRRRRRPRAPPRARDLLEHARRRDEEAHAGAAGRAARDGAPARVDRLAERRGEREAVQVDAERGRGRAPRRGRRRAARRARRRAAPSRADDGAACRSGPSSIAERLGGGAAPPRRRRRTCVGSSALGQTCASATPNAGGSATTRSVTVSGDERAADREGVHGHLAARPRAPRRARRSARDARERGSNAGVELRRVAHEREALLALPVGRLDDAGVAEPAAAARASASVGRPR